MPLRAVRQRRVLVAIPSFGHTIADVVATVPNEEMLGIKTRGIVAAM